MKAQFWTTLTFTNRRAPHYTRDDQHAIDQSLALWKSKKQSEAAIPPSYPDTTQQQNQEIRCEKQKQQGKPA